MSGRMRTDEVGLNARRVESKAHRQIQINRPPEEEACTPRDVCGAEIIRPARPTARWVAPMQNELRSIQREGATKSLLIQLSLS